jgi:hypothetical protein
MLAWILFHPDMERDTPLLGQQPCRCDSTHIVRIAVLNYSNEPDVKEVRLCEAHLDHGVSNGLHVVFPQKEGEEEDGDPLVKGTVTLMNNSWANGPPKSGSHIRGRKRQLHKSSRPLSPSPVQRRTGKG